MIQEYDAGEMIWDQMQWKLFMFRGCVNKDGGLTRTNVQMQKKNKSKKHMYKC